MAAEIKSYMSRNGNDSSISGKADDADGNIRVMVMRIYSASQKNLYFQIHIAT